MSDFLSKFLISTHLTMYTKLKDQNNIRLVKLISEEEKKLEMYLFTRYERLTTHENIYSIRTSEFLNNKIYTLNLKTTLGCIIRYRVYNVRFLWSSNDSGNK